MMETPRQKTPRASSLRRSRNGCRECRRRHRRCDEIKPACSYCRSVEKACEYSRELSWGGRPFKKSRFGRCITKDQGLVEIPSATASRKLPNRRSPDREFVYSWMPDYSTRPAEETLPARESPIQSVISDSGAHGCVDTEQLADWPVEHVASPTLSLEIGISQIFDPPGDEVEEVICSGHENMDMSEYLTSPGPLTPTLIPLSQLSSLSIHHQNLLDCFQHDVCTVLACHDGSQRDLCSAFIPMAHDSPHLLAAMLCTAASRRYATGQHVALEEVTALRSNAIRLLSSAINVQAMDLTPARHHVDTIVVALATSIVLCLSEIVSSENTGGGWRVYLSGASALMERLRDIPASQAGFSINFVKRLYSSLKAVSVGCGLDVGKLIQESSHELNEDEICGDKEDNFIDDFAGFSTSLIPVFEEIHSKNRGGGFGTTPVTLPLPDWKQRLIEKVQLMLITRKPRFRPGVAASLSLGVKTDFWLLDEAYHHMALLCLLGSHEHRLDGSTSWHGTLKQASIERVIACVGAMDMTRKPSPGVAVLPPLFTAGCAATDEGDIVRILALLRFSRGSFGMGNVLSTERVLEKRWKMLKHCEGGLSMGHVRVQGEEDLDFLPY